MTTLNITNFNQYSTLSSVNYIADSLTVGAMSLGSAWVGDVPFNQFSYASSIDQAIFSAGSMSYIKIGRQAIFAGYYLATLDLGANTTINFNIILPSGLEHAYGTTIVPIRGSATAWHTTNTVETLKIRSDGLSSTGLFIDIEFASGNITNTFQLSWNVILDIL